jgi:type IV secretory pathway TrbF-like protein
VRTLTHREKIIAACVGAVTLLYVGSSYVLMPYLAKRDGLSSAINKAKAQQKKDADLLANRNAVDSEWKKLTATAITTQPDVGINNVSNAFYDWERSSRIKIQSVKPGSPVQKGDFKQIQFQVTAFGSTIAVSSFLRILDTTALPVRIEKLRINPVKEGADYLNLTITVNTLVFAPPPTTKAAPRSAAPRGDTL